MSTSTTTNPPAGDAAVENLMHEGEAHRNNMSGRLNWLRAGVLGANDGVTSTAGVVVGVAGATPEIGPILIAGVAAVVAGSLSMAAGEYVSVSTQRDSERAQLAKEERELRETPEHELEELTQIYEAKGIDRDLAEQVAVQLTKKDALRAHAEAELGIDVDELTSPIHAAFASLVAFAVGAIIPMLAILNPVVEWRVPMTFVLVLIALAVTGYVSARLGQAPWLRAVIRNMLGGTVAMLITYGVGAMIGGHVLG